MLNVIAFLVKKQYNLQNHATNRLEVTDDDWKGI